MLRYMFFNKSKRSVDAVHAASVKDKNTDLKKERGRVEVGFRDDPPLAYNNFILKKLKKTYINMWMIVLVLH